VNGNYFFSLEISSIIGGSVNIDRSIKQWQATVLTATNAPHLEAMYQSIPLIQHLVVSFILTIRSEYFLKDDTEIGHNENGGWHCCQIFYCTFLLLPLHLTDQQKHLFILASFCYVSLF
jgi:hypothetical protein